MTLVDDSRLAPARPLEHAASRRWFLSSLGALGVAVVVVTGLHFFLGAKVNPVEEVISDYALTGGEGWFAVTALALAGGMALLVVGLARAGIELGNRFRLLACGWCVGLAVCAFIPTDPTGGARTVGGSIHLAAGAMLFTSLPPALRILARNLGPEHARLSARLHLWTRWCWVIVAAFAATQVMIIFAGPGASTALPVQGLCERLAFATYVVTLAQPALALARRR
ncbi:DUF998 domain-containing protein [Amycolatopsis acidicola]|uniref:DUF998 domain-containing protein n=1 Tax=Amycolatopsis acidicola TaxID=2596893 RepID=UPI00140BC149|nr:DUF998 domain-containing protein [Amycolatopsis acidicola]